MRKLLLLSILSVFLWSGDALAQDKINNVIKVDFNNIQAIKNGSKTTGYYIFYKADKIKRGDYSYRLRILDENAKKVAEKRIIASKNFFLLEAKYNQELLCFKFYDIKEKKVSLKFYDKDAKEVESKSYEVDKLEKRNFSMAINQGIKTEPSLYAMGNKGFLNYRIVKNKKMGYEIKYYPNSKSEKSWTFKSKENSPVVEYAVLLEANANIVLNMVGIRSGQFSKDVDFLLSGLDPETGKEIFRTKLENSKFEESITNSFYNSADNQINLFGYYFPKGEKVVGGKSLGMVMTSMNLEGKIINKKYNSWSKDVAKFLPSNAKGKLDEIGFIYFHEFVQSADGSVTGVGESYRKTVSAAGAASKVLALASGSTGSASAFQITVNDFYFFDFDKDFNLIGVEYFEKDKTRIGLPSGAAVYGPQYLALYTYYYGGFDFSYLKQLDDANNFLVFYQDYERKKGEKNKTVCGVISKTDGDYNQDKVDINTEADLVKVLPAQAGNVLFIEYFKKDEQLDVKFQKMNY